jgi:hypothetical protein
VVAQYSIGADMQAYRGEATADLEALLGRWSDPLSPFHVVQARAWLQRSYAQQ